MSHALAYFLSWRCYATWLPGDERGWVDRKHTRHGTPFLPAHRGLESHMRQGLPHPPVTLSEAARAVAEAAIRKQCALRAWQLLALNVRTNHVHCVVVARGTRPETVMPQLKSWATRWLRRERLFAPEQPVWARHGSTRYLWTREQVDRARMYVFDAQ